MTKECKEWFDPLLPQDKRKVNAVIDRLKEKGPRLGRPHADTLKSSKISNLKELITSTNTAEYRILYAFDPKRTAVLLVGGSKIKRGTSKLWYSRMIPIAERLFAEHLENLKRKDNKS